MKSRGLSAGFWLILLLALFGAVTTVHAQPPRAESAGAAIEQPDVESALIDKTWQLVRIMSMDDTESVPDDRSRYTLRLKADGTAQVRADCNRAMGPWASEQAGKLQFGPLAATKALCPPGSLHDTFLAQFQWVGSYVMRNGKLFLATMADGSIIEFEPQTLPLAATVLGEEVRTSDAGEMQEIVLTRLFDRYAQERRITVSDAEIDAYVESMHRGMRERGLTAEDELSADEAAEVDRMRREMGRSMIRQWKLNRALYKQYGGRIVFQQLGPEPLDAYRQYLEERQAAGDFTIHEARFETTFWDYFTNDAKHSFYEQGSAEEAEAFATPPWQTSADGDTEASTQPAASQDALPLPPEAGGPLNWEVRRGVRGLNLRAQASTAARIIARYEAGTVLDNLGCLRAEDRVWCNVQKLGGGPVGYVAVEFIVPAVSPDGSVAMGPDDSALRAGRGEFDATGRIACAQYAGQPTIQCDFGVARAGGGYATVVVTKPDGMKRAIFFRRGVAIGADTSEADGYGEFRVETDHDLHLIRVGQERYEIPDAVILGG